MSALIDFSQIITAQDKQTSEQQAREQKARAECHRRIVEVVSEAAQINLSAAAVAGTLSDSDRATYRAILGWITQMRTTWRPLAEAQLDVTQDHHWPRVPDDAQAFLRDF